jgi:hypothetical protein
MWRLSIALLAGCGAFAHYTAAYTFDGAAHYTLDGDSARFEPAAVRDAAAREFACSDVAVDQPYNRAYVATGCGRHAVFVVASAMASDPQRIPGHDGTYVVSEERAIDVTAPGSATDPLGTDLRKWRALIAAGARDLACPIDQVVPDLVPQYRAPEVPIAEGCGHRASYVAEQTSLRLIGLVTAR